MRIIRAIKYTILFKKIMRLRRDRDLDGITELLDQMPESERFGREMSLAQAAFCELSNKIEEYEFPIFEQFISFVEHSRNENIILYARAMKEFKVGNYHAYVSAKERFKREAGNFYRQTLPLW